MLEHLKVTAIISLKFKSDETLTKIVAVFSGLINKEDLAYHGLTLTEDEFESLIKNKSVTLYTRYIDTLYLRELPYIKGENV